MGITGITGITGPGVDLPGIALTKHTVDRIVMPSRGCAIAARHDLA